jgi:hypothetical protein
LDASYVQLDTFASSDRHGARRRFGRFEIKLPCAERVRHLVKDAAFNDYGVAHARAGGGMLYIREPDRRLREKHQAGLRIANDPKRFAGPRQQARACERGDRLLACEQPARLGNETLSKGEREDERARR